MLAQVSQAHIDTCARRSRWSDSAKSRKSRRWSAGWRAANARSAPARCSTFRAAARHIEPWRGATAFARLRIFSPLPPLAGRGGRGPDGWPSLTAPRCPARPPPSLSREERGEGKEGPHLNRRRAATRASPCWRASATGLPHCARTSEDVAAALRDRRGLVQQRAGKHHPGARAGLVAMGIVFGETAGLRPRTLPNSGSPTARIAGMRRQARRCLGIELLEHPQDFHAGVRIEVARRLVGQQQGRSVDQRRGRWPPAAAGRRTSARARGRRGRRGRRDPAAVGQRAASAPRAAATSSPRA